jgi:hypothetical protein
MRYETSTLPTASDLNAFLRELLLFFVRTRTMGRAFGRTKSAAFCVNC